ncbi:unnamed protein product [Fraxinus pennsylvanica]|uniref:PWWP domain-containing protein n=1 Tax=Fraxinus pennsylvanica TaxID=56036 RepID=A0AAD1ZN43_9LAMI|nr:unnamed protein product [Fraxinus pennsylvanica]
MDTDWYSGLVASYNSETSRHHLSKYSLRSGTHLSGHAMWASIILGESLVGKLKGLNRISRGKSVPVQFFGTHDFSRFTRKQVISFLQGLLSSCHLKYKKPNFVRALEEEKMYLSEQKLQKRMLRLQDGVAGDDHDYENGGDEESVGEECGQ